MNRRQLLALIGAGAGGGLAGCAGFDSPGDTATEATTVTETNVTATRPDPASFGQVANEDLPIDVEDMIVGLPQDAIRSITEPTFGPDWEGLSITHFLGTEHEFVTEPRLTDRDTIISVVREGEARAYPLRVLAGHEIINDDFAGPLLVTYCPVCASGLTMVRKVRGEVTIFGVTGLLWKLNLVMYDQLTRSLWSQAAATAINGEVTGDTLELVPSSLTTWVAWREEYPDTDVLLPPPLSKPLYYGQFGMNATGLYLEPPSSLPDSPSARDFNRGQFTHVLGISYNGASRAYPLPVVFAEKVVNDSVGDVPVLVAVAPGNSLVGYERTVAGETLTFEFDDNRHVRGGGSRWRLATELAVSGPFAGERLTRATDVPQLFWETWKDFNPETTVYADYPFTRPKSEA